MSRAGGRLTRDGLIQIRVGALEWLETNLLARSEGISVSEAGRLALREACVRRGLRQVALDQIESGEPGVVPPLKGQDRSGR